MPSKVFIAGEHGQLACALARAYSARGDIVMTAGRSKVDVANSKAVRSAILGFNPHVVINAAAYTGVDDAEDNADLAFLINCHGAENVAASARLATAILIHLSTDYIFDGSKVDRYVETDLPDPIGVYGRSKLAGEKAVSAEAGDYVILRTSWLFGETGNNFVSRMLQRASNESEVAVVDDQWGTPTFAADLANAIVNIDESIRSAADRSTLCGVYHAAGSGWTSRYEFAQAIMASSKKKGGPFCRVRPVHTNQFVSRARRPFNSGLDSSKLARSFGIHLPSWKISLDRCLDRMLSDLPEQSA